MICAWGIEFDVWAAHSVNLLPLLTKIKQKANWQKKQLMRYCCIPYNANSLGIYLLKRTQQPLGKNPWLLFLLTSLDNKKEELMAFKKWECVICGFIYDEEKGLPDEGIAAGTRWDDVPEDWECPECGVSKYDFEMVLATA